MKKTPLKVAQNQPQFFLCTVPAAQTAQKQKSRTLQIALMQDWVFRLRLLMASLSLWTLVDVFVLS